MKVNPTRIEVAVMAVALVVLVALAIAPAFWGNAFGQEGRTSTEENAANTNEPIGDGQQYSIESIVIRRADGEFTVRAKDRSEMVVVDDYDVLRTITVQFNSGSAVLSAAAKAALDETAERIQNDKLKGWVLAIVGYADSTENTARNHSLSQRRAEAVINYLVTKHDLPMRRLVQPFGYGSAHPVASNDTRSGRAQNRRAEIRIMVNKGIISQSGSPERTAVVSLTNVP